MPRIFTIVSVVVHAVVVGSAFVAQVLAVGSLPIPRRPLTFEGATSIRVVDIHLPSPPRRVARAGTPSLTLAPETAPIDAPAGIQPDSGIDHSGGAPSDLVVGVEPGVSVVAGIGTIEHIPPPPPPPRQTPIHLHSGMQAPRKMVHVEPVYPRVAQAAHIEGVVILEAVIDAQGRVERVGVLRSIPQLDQAAVDAVKHWTFTATLLNGVPVPIVMTVTVNFKLRD
jgi:protein TonB